MPWCEDCAKYWAPVGDAPGRHVPDVRPQPAKPTGARSVTADNLDLKQLAAGDADDEDDAKAPWHFKLLVVLLVLYLVWRFVHLLDLRHRTRAPQARGVRRCAGDRSTERRAHR